MANLLLRPLRLWVMYLPQLAACYLMGLLGRNIVIELAAKYGWNNYLVVDLLMPFAGLARLGAIVAMFMVLRSAIPALAAMPKISLRHIDLFSNIVLPFFAIYLGWRMFRDDWVAFEQKAMWHRVGARMSGNTETVSLDHLPVSDYVWYLIVGAFVLRYLIQLKAVKTRLPKWFVFCQVYLDAVWVFLALTYSANRGVTFFLNPSGYFKERRIVVWAETTRAALFSHFRPLEISWTLFTGTWHIVWSVAAVPLVWLAIAGIIYGSSNKASWRGVFRRVAGKPAAAAVDKLTPARDLVQNRVSERIRTKTKGWLLSQFGSAAPIIDSARLVLHGGLVALSAYVFLYQCVSWLDMSDSFLRPQMQVGGYLVRGFAWLLGPHPEYFWDAVGPVLTALSGALIGSLRVCLIASVFAHCVERVEIESDLEPTDEVVEYPDDTANTLSGSAGSH